MFVLSVNLCVYGVARVMISARCIVSLIWYYYDCVLFIVSSIDIAMPVFLCVVIVVSMFILCDCMLCLYVFIYVMSYVYVCLCMY